MTDHGPGHGLVLTEEEKRRRRMRSVVIALSLAGLAILFFLVTIVRLGGNVGGRPF
jgi:hypothetical protein